MVDIFGGGFLIIGVVLLITALYLFLRQWSFVSRSRSVTGEVVDNVRQAGEDGWANFPVVEFQTEAGTTVTFKDSLGTGWVRYRRGERVPVLYHPARPSEARIQSFGSLWLACLSVGVFGLVFTACGGLLLLGGLLPR
jgi:hypothetical protein